ncbi:MAG: hypothetical protein IKY83_06820 [Proteobacteria bacterium]|nr:hypothetical protein [Pseudomonadota bacterium]
MAEQYRMMISMDGREAQPCMPFDVCEVGLNDGEMAGTDRVAVRIVSVKDVLKVSATGLVEVTLERGGRKKTIGTQEIVLLPEDVICYGVHRIEIVKIWKQAAPKQRRLPSLKKLLGAAAAFVMAAVPACQPRGMGDVPNPNVDLSADEDTTAPVVDVVEMGEPVDTEYENYEWVKAMRAEEARKAEEAKNQAGEGQDMGASNRSDGADGNTPEVDTTVQKPVVPEVKDAVTPENNAPREGALEAKAAGSGTSETLEAPGQPAPKADKGAEVKQKKVKEVKKKKVVKKEYMGLW